MNSSPSISGRGSGRTEETPLPQEGNGNGILEGISFKMGFSMLDPEERSRRLVAVLVTLIITPALLGACLYYARKGLYTTALIVLPVAISFSFIPLQLRSVKNAANLYRVNLALAGLMFLHLFYIAAPHGHQALWFFLFPVPCFFQLGKREGLVGSLLLCLLMLLVFVVFDLLLGSVQFDHGFLIRFTLVYLLLSGCAYSYESVRTIFREKMEKKQMELIQEKEKLAQSKQLVEAASAAKSEFLANMSHELRTPLNHILGFTQLLTDSRFGETNARQKEYLSYVLQSGNQLLSLISDILDLTEIESGKLRLNDSEVNLNDFLENTLAGIRQDAQRNGIRFTQDLSGVPEVIRCDGRKLRHVMQNLLSNAVKFTPRGGSIHLTARQIAQEDRRNGQEGSERLPVSFDPGFPNGKVLMIAVRDTGIGIRREDLERIFKPFEQVEKSSSRRYKGTGLGLPLTRSFVELHGGKVWAESDGKDQGSTFRFVIPIHGGEGMDSSAQEEMNGRRVLA